MNNGSLGNAETAISTPSQEQTIYDILPKKDLGGMGKTHSPTWVWGSDRPPKSV
ncbi:MAG: hypothetical protein FWD71_06585 [Oscillospiraceae bacterium]|nr:hypothetical protein [Oscillospiraceae bacterium]